MSILGTLSVINGYNMLSKPKVAFVYHHLHPEIWMDGLSHALDVLEDDFDIRRLNIAEYEMWYHELENQDFILGWGAFGSPVDKALTGMDRFPTGKAKMGLCIAGVGIDKESAALYDVLFYETKWYRPYIDWHENIVHAFGVNTDIFFKIDLPTPIIWDYIGVGSFASWKRWEKMKIKKGNRLVIGQYQNLNEDESLPIVKDLIKNGVMVSNEVDPFKLSTLMSCSRTAYIPSSIVGGGERFLLEARACGLTVEIEEDNLKLKELLEGPIYDHIYYAKKLKEGILSVL